MADGAGTTYGVLFLCTGNSARSIMAECILRREGGGRFDAYSAGSHPAGTLNPYAVELLERMGHPIDGLRSKSWDEFAAPGAPPLDVVITVCDAAAGEVCPVWPGRPATAHWGFPDPAAFTGSEAETRAFFADVYGQILGRIKGFVSLPLDSLDRAALRRRLDEIGRTPPARAQPEGARDRGERE